MAKFPARKALLYFIALPWNLLIAWPTVLLVHALWGKDLRWELEALTTEMRLDSWPAKTWYKRWGGTTLGHGIFYKGDRRAKAGAPWLPLQVHEHVHVEQYEASMLGTFLLACALWAFVPWWIALGVWTSGYLVMGVGAWGAAWLRGEDPYRGSHHEEAAYSIDGRSEN